jgi:transposase InsO family protein
MLKLPKRRLPSKIESLNSVSPEGKVTLLKSVQLLKAPLPIAVTDSGKLTSDQGYQYQLMAYRRFLKEHGMSQSMSRKGNCLDNSPTENFFGRLKVEMYYDREYSFKSLADLERQIRRYIEYWNSSQIVGRLGASPISVRNAELGIPSN